MTGQLVRSRGVCSVCHRSQKINQAGLIGHHAQAGAGAFGSPCEGIGKIPAYQPRPVLKPVGESLPNEAGRKFEVVTNKVDSPQGALSNGVGAEKKDATPAPTTSPLSGNPSSFTGNTGTITASGGAPGTSPVECFSGSGGSNPTKTPADNSNIPIVVAPESTPKEILTPVEKEALTLIDQLTVLVSKIVTEGPHRQGDLNTMLEHIRHLQFAIMAQGTARAYPGTYRVLGED